MPWERPGDIKGRVWTQFQGRKREGNSRPVNYQIQDAGEKDREKCVEFLTQTFLRDEPLCKTLDILSDPDSVATIQANWRGFLQQGVSLACYAVDKDGQSTNELAAVAMCLVCCVDDEKQVDFDQIKGEPWKRLLKTLLAADRAYNVFQQHSVDKFFSIHVLAVAPNHRGVNLGVELFRASEDLARALDLKFISAVCTATESQHLAAKCRYNLLAQLPYSTMLVEGVDLSRYTADSALIMGKEL